MTNRASSHESSGTSTSVLVSSNGCPAEGCDMPCCPLQVSPASFLSLQQKYEAAAAMVLTKEVPALQWQGRALTATSLAAGGAAAWAHHRYTSTLLRVWRIRNPAQAVRLYHLRWVAAAVSTACFVGTFAPGYGCRARREAAEARVPLYDAAVLRLVTMQRTAQRLERELRGGGNGGKEPDGAWTMTGELAADWYALSTAAPIPH